MIDKFIVKTGEPEVDNCSTAALINLQGLVKSGLPNDKTKFALPDAYKTELTWTINARSLQNFLKLRSASSAMWEIRRLAFDVYDMLPEDHKFIFDEFMSKRPDDV